MEKQKPFYRSIGGMCNMSSCHGVGVKVLSRPDLGFTLTLGPNLGCIVCAHINIWNVGIQVFKN